MLQVKEIPIHPDYYKYPSSDGEPMAETTQHFRWIVTIKENLEMATIDQPIFVAGDLLWYPVKGNIHICKAPDVMVAIGRPKGDRMSYLQWLEDGVAPQVVFEVFSKSNRRRKNKEGLLDFYLKYGVEEYYSYDPDKNSFVVRLNNGTDFSTLTDPATWTSPLLGIHFKWSEQGFQVLHPNGRPFVGFLELEQRNTELVEQNRQEQKARQEERKQLLRAERKALEQAKAEQQRAEDAEKLVEEIRQRAETERQRAETERQRAETERQRAEAAELKQAALMEKLRTLGLDPDNL